MDNTINRLRRLLRADVLDTGVLIVRFDDSDDAEDCSLTIEEARAVFQEGITIDGTLLAANNLSDLTDTAAARTNLGLTGLLEFEGTISCAANPNYPVGVVGDSYIVSSAGKIGGASGTSVDAGDLVICIVDNAGGTQASVGSSWSIVEHNLAGALLAANNLSDIADAATARSNLGLIIGTNVQAYHANLAALAGLNFTAGAALRVLQINSGGGVALGNQLTPDRLMVTDATGYVSYNGVTATEAGYLSGVTSAIQTQFSNKQPLNANLTSLAALTATGYKVLQLVNGVWTLSTLTGSRGIVTDANGNLTQATTTATEIGYVNGVTSAIQTQLDARILKNLGTTKGDIITYSASNIPVRFGVGTDGQVLTASSGASFGLTWATPSGGSSSDYVFTYEAGTGNPSTGCFRYGSNNLYFSKTDANGKTVTSAGLQYRLPADGGILAIHSSTLDVGMYGTSNSSPSDQTTHWRFSGVTLNRNALSAASSYILTTGDNPATLTGTTNEISVTSSYGDHTLALASNPSKLTANNGGTGSNGANGMSPGGAGTPGMTGSPGADYNDGSVFYTGGSGGAGGLALGGAVGTGGSGGTGGPATVSLGGNTGNFVSGIIGGGTGGVGGIGGDGGMGGTGNNGTNGQDATISGPGANGEPGASANGGDGGVGGIGGTGGSADITITGGNNYATVYLSGGTGGAGDPGGTGDNGGSGTSGGTGTAGASGTGGAGAYVLVSGANNIFAAQVFGNGTTDPANFNVTGNCNQVAGYLNGCDLSVGGIGNSISVYNAFADAGISGNGNSVNAALSSGQVLSVTGSNNIVAGASTVTFNNCIVAAGKPTHDNAIVFEGSHRYFFQLINSTSGNAIWDINNTELPDGLYIFELLGTQHDSGSPASGSKAGKITGSFTVSGSTINLLHSENATDVYTGGATTLDLTISDTANTSFTISTSATGKDYFFEIHIVGRGTT